MHFQLTLHLISVFIKVIYVLLQMFAISATFLPVDLRDLIFKLFLRPAVQSQLSYLLLLLLLFLFLSFFFNVLRYSLWNAMPNIKQVIFVLFSCQINTFCLQADFFT